MYLPCSTFTIYVGVFAVFLPSSLTETPAFTKTPSNLTVNKGSDVFIEWRYNVTDRGSVFAVSSPVWNYYDKADTKFPLGVEDNLDNGKWTISTSTCPKRLTDPILRIHKYQSGVTGFAGLNITNVTVEDSGRYQCKLKLQSGAEAPESSMYLTVKEPPPTTTAPPPTAPTKTTSGTKITTNTVFTGTTQPPPKEVISKPGETAKLVWNVDFGINTWVKVTIYRSKDKVTSGGEKIIDLNKSDGVKNKYLSKREKDIDLVVQVTSNMVSVTFTLQNSTTNDTMFYRMSLVKSNGEIVDQYMFLRVSATTQSPPAPTKPTKDNTIIIVVVVVVVVVVLLIIVGVGYYFWRKSCGCSCRCQCTFLSTFPCCCPCCFLCCRQRSDQNDGKGDVVLKNKVDKEGNDNTQPTA